MSHRAPPATQPAALEVLEARRLVAEMFFTLPHAAGTVTSPLVGTASLEVSLQPAGEEPADDEADAAFASMDLFPHVDSRASLFASQGQRRLGSAAVGTRALPQPLPWPRVSMKRWA